MSFGPRYVRPAKGYKPCAECGQQFFRHHHGNEKYCAPCRWKLFGIRRGWLRDERERPPHLPHRGSRARALER
jgi:hypothetical protein